ncbi:MAG: protease complex subunit PrcB family protein [Candidatus Melainabacteria bacterium]|nr:protease complex subunit PrcB family protein [Candidatus Melainabacteria bacterium]
MPNRFNKPYLCLSVLASVAALAASPVQAKDLTYVQGKGAPKTITQKPLPPMPHITQAPVKRLVKVVQPALPMEALDSGEKSGIRLFQAVVIQSKPDLDLLWSRHKPGQPAPDIDFENHTVLAVFDGQKNRAGYQVQIVSIRRTESGANVGYRVTRVGNSAASAAINVQPYAIVKTNKVVGSVAFGSE